MAAQVKPGTHLACMGTDTKGKQEVEAALLAGATVFTDEVAQSVSIGEAQHAIAAGLIAESAITQIGAVINGAHPGRTSAEEITLFDGTGVGLQDLAVAAAVVDLARRPARRSRSTSDHRLPGSSRPGDRRVSAGTGGLLGHSKVTALELPACHDPTTTTRDAASAPGGPAASAWSCC